MRTALVTGGSGGIGQVLVEMLRARGYRVAVADRVAPRESDHYVSCDLANPETALSIVADAKQALGRIDALVLCAARYDASTLDRCTLDEFRDVMRINLESPMALVKAWLALDANAKPGVVVLVGSAAGHVGSRDPAYSASKAGLLGLTRSLALNLTDRGYSVFSVSPGLIDTAMSSVQGDERKSAHLARTMLKRAGRPEEVARVIAWLVDERPHYMSGADMNISNGIAW